MAMFSVDKVSRKEIFVSPYPEGYNDQVWVLFRDGKPFRIYHSEDLALSEMARLEQIYASIQADGSEPEEQKLVSNGSKSSPP